MNAIQFVTHNQGEIDINGTSYQGDLMATYSELTDLFGKPTEGDEYKVDAEWMIRFSDGTVATVYNWKNGVNYCGPKDGIPTKEITDWHVGGFNEKAMENVQIMIDLRRETKPKGDIGEMIESRETLLESIKMKHGEKFKDAVEFAYLISKQQEVFNLVMQGAASGEAMPKNLGRMLDMAYVQMTAKIMSSYTEANGSVPTVKEARELMSWADRLIEVEQSGINAFLHSQKEGGEK